MLLNDKVIFGNLELRIYKRKAIDVIELAEFARKQQSDTAQIFQMAKIVSDSLKHNIIHLKWWKIFSYFFMRELTSVKGLLKYFTIDEINEIALKVLEYEGVDVNSKKSGNQSVDFTDFDLCVSILMHFYNIGREEALNYDIDNFRKRITDAIKLGHFGISGQIDLEDSEAKNNWQYRKEFSQ